MAWFVVILSGLFEAVWATALSKPQGFTKVTPSVVFMVSVIISMGGLAWIMKTIPVGTCYAVWVGIGAVTTAAWAMTSGAESVSLLKVRFLLGIIGRVVGSSHGLYRRGALIPRRRPCFEYHRGAIEAR